MGLFQNVEWSHLRAERGQRSCLSGIECILRLVGLVKVYRSNTVIDHLTFVHYPSSLQTTGACLNVNSKELVGR